MTVAAPIDQPATARRRLLKQCATLALAPALANSVAERFKAGGGQVLQQLSFQSGGDTDLTALATQATVGKAQVIVAGAVDVALIAARLRKLNSQIQLATAPATIT